ncbi:MAG: hypothetical protein JSV31_01700 [Desulfobacterales bacterium]|nr:MAG: hypothetical protein JSV31_01700 [Desulfobacterales bacterium]
MIISYVTDKDKLTQYLPEPFEVGAEPIVSVIYSMNKLSEGAMRNYCILSKCYPN